MGTETRLGQAPGRAPLFLWIANLTEKRARDLRRHQRCSLRFGRAMLLLLKSRTARLHVLSGVVWFPMKPRLLSASAPVPRSMSSAWRFACVIVLFVLAGCAVSPVAETQVVVMKRGAMPEDPGLPPPGTTWRLDERDLVAMSPAPYVPPPPTPVPPPPTVVVAPAVPYMAPYSLWGAPYYGPAFGFSFGYFHSRHSHRRWRR